MTIGFWAKRNTLVIFHVPEGWDIIKNGEQFYETALLTVILMMLVRGCLFLLFTSEVVGSLLGYPKLQGHRGLREERQLMPGGRVLPKLPCGFSAKFTVATRERSSLLGWLLPIWVVVSLQPARKWAPATFAPWWGAGPRVASLL